MAQNFWALVILWGLIKTRLHFFHGGRVQDHLAVNETQTLGTRGQCVLFVPASVNLTTTSHPPMLGPQSVFLMTPHEPHSHWQHLHSHPDENTDLTGSNVFWFSVFFNIMQRVSYNTELLSVSYFCSNFKMYLK